MNNVADALTPRSRGAIGKDRRSETPRSGYTKIKTQSAFWKMRLFGDTAKAQTSRSRPFFHLLRHLGHAPRESVHNGDVVL
jgi:hypothetical protein